MNRIIGIIVTITFILIAFVSVLLIIKPGAAIFHIKNPLSSNEFRTFEKQSLYAPLAIDSRIYPLENILLFEGDLPLYHTYTADVVDGNPGSFSLVEREQGVVNLVISPTTVDRIENGKEYTLYLKPIFFSRATGLSLLFLLGLGFAWFLQFAIKSPNKKEYSLNNPWGVFNLVAEFFKREAPNVVRPVTNSLPLQESRRDLWLVIILLTIVASFFYVFMEWIFFVTKPSFMDLMPWIDKTEILFVSSAALMFASLAVVLVFAGLDWLISRFRTISLLVITGTLVPAALLSAACLILLDNFTYTIFKFGVVSSEGFVRFLYGFIFFIVLIFIDRWILGLLGLRGSAKSTIKTPRTFTIFASSLLILSALVPLIHLGEGYLSKKIDLGRLVQESNNSNPLPNIILIGSDGLNATSMSVYGYGRDTTPFLRELAKSSLVAENAFTNSSNSEGSIVSILTGMPPAETRVVYPPNILQGEHAYQHLPGILRDEGYYNVELAVPHYVDAFKANLLDGFSIVNGQEIEENSGIRIARELGFGNTAYFGDLITERILDRLLHISFLRRMENPYTTVTETPAITHDREQLEQLISLIQTTDAPVFAHVHFMGTHGPQFSPEKVSFSVGHSQDEDWMPDFYDDSIRTFDFYISNLMAELEKSGEIDNTVLIIYSDHPQKYDVRLRIPLMFHFPDGEYSGRIKENVQNLDIAPTILDFLNIEQPAWMAGQSLINSEIIEIPLIFNTGTSKLMLSENRNFVIAPERVMPPFYQFSFFNVINCHQWYWFDLQSLEWESGEVPGHTMPCSRDELMSMDEIEEELAEYMDSHRFDVSTLPFP